MTHHIFYGCSAALSLCNTGAHVIVRGMMNHSLGKLGSHDKLNYITEVAHIEMSYQHFPGNIFNEEQ